MPRKIRDKVEYMIVEEEDTISVYARITAQTAKQPSRKRQFVGLPEVEECLRAQGKQFGKVLVNPGYITAAVGSYSEYVFEKPVMEMMFPPVRKASEYEIVEQPAKKSKKSVNDNL